MSIFKAYDVRGIYQKELDESLAGKIGAAFVKVTGAKSLAVGRDMRDSAPSIADAFMDGAAAMGASVVDIGLASTPMTYYGIGSLGTDGGAQVTASHNPAEWIGFKFCRKGCVPMSSATGIKEMESLIAGGLTVPSGPRAPRTHANLLDGFAQHVAAFGMPTRPLKIVIDAGNGMGGHTAPAVLKAWGVSAVCLFFELDGSFPNHEANPIKEENLRDLVARVRTEHADIGIAFDGDADRCVFVDERGSPVPSDAITALLARELLKRDPGASVVYDLRSSWSIPEIIKECGGRPVRERVGHSFIKATMRKESAILGGELSGHFYFRDHWYSDSGEIAMAMVLGLLSRSNATLSELVAPTRRYASTGEVNFHAEDKDAVIAALKARFSDGKMDELDGITVQYADWWFNVRKSNTEPLLRLNLEARTQALLAEKRALLVPMLGKPE